MTSPPQNYSAWQSAWEDSRSRLNEISESLNSAFTTPSRITRVGQLDSELLDQELVQLLKEPIAKALGLVNVAQLFPFYPKSLLNESNFPVCV